MGIEANFKVAHVGFFARPLGIIFGHFGDRIGRKMTLVTSLFLMGLATFAIGLLSTYDSIGVGSYFTYLSRLLRGIGLGGEWGGASLMAVEHAPKGKRGLFGSAIQMGAPAGLLISTGVISLVLSNLSEEVSINEFKQYF